MKGKSILLYLLGICFLIIGNRNLWDEIQEDIEKENNSKKKNAQAKEAANKKFETQQLVYDQEKKQWKNPHLFFQVVNAGSNINFKALNNKSKKTTVEFNDDEDATDSN